MAASQVRAGEWWLAKLGIKRAWAVTKGRGVKVGVLDSGIAASHPDLRGAVVGGTDVSGQGNATGTKPLADNAEPDHGTGMAGYIAGRGHDGVGMIGAAPDASLLSVSASTGNDRDSSQQYGRGLRWLVDHGAKVVNMSFGGDVPQADIAYAQAHDVVLVAGSGNDSRVTGLGPPASFYGVVVVSGVDENLATDPRATVAGPAFEGEDNALHDAGGVAVAGPYADNAGDAGPGDGQMVAIAPPGDVSGPSGYRYSEGTSNATAILSGIVALIRAAHPDLDAANVVNRLIQTATHVNPKGTGYDGKQGFGVPNAYRAITLDLPKVCENPLGSTADPASVGAWRAVKDNTKYTPKCTDTPSSSSPASSPSSSGSSDASSGGSQPASSDSAVPPQASSSDSGGIPVWVWLVVAVVVVALVVALLLARRRTSRPAGPPPGYGPPPPGYGPPR